MLPPHKTRELARSLVASEADAATIPLHTEPATVRVYERLRRQLGAPVGIDGFQALASRALALAKSESPRLSAVQVTANGGLRGLGEVESEMNAGRGRRGRNHSDCATARAVSYLPWRGNNAAFDRRFTPSG